jgi:regulatory protein
MIITSIEKQKKKGRYNIFLDGEFAFGAYEDTVFQFGLRKNDELTQEKINEIIDFDEFNYGKKYAYNLLARFPKSEKEIRTKLKQKKISEKNIIRVISKLNELKVLDDKDFAKIFIESKLRTHPSGKGLLKNKLIEKGISKEIIEESLEKYYDDETEESKADKILTKYMNKKTSDDIYTKKRKCFQHLASKGFGFDLINELLRKYFK